MSTDIEHNIFAGALALWVGYMLSAKLPVLLDSYAATHIVLVFYSVLFSAVGLRMGFSLQNNWRFLIYTVTVLNALWAAMELYNAAMSKLSLSLDAPWQAYLLPLIIFFWVLSVEIARAAMTAIEGLRQKLQRLRQLEGPHA